MLHLIKLELKKRGPASYLWGPIIAYTAIAGFLMMIYFVDGPNAEEPMFVDLGESLIVIDLLVRATFIIYASVLLANLIISEFKDKTISLLFAYPINRRKLIFAKLSIVFFWSLLNMIIGNLLIDALFIAVNSHFGYVPGSLTNVDLNSHGLFVLMQAIGAAGMSLLPLFIGMRKKSVPATIVTSIVIVAIVCSNNMGFSLSSIIAVPLTLSALGILIAYLSFRNIDRADVA